MIHDFFCVRAQLSPIMCQDPPIEGNCEGVEIMAEVVESLFV